MSFHIYFYLCLAIRVRDFYLSCQSSNDKPCQRWVVVIGQLTLKQKWTVTSVPYGRNIFLRFIILILLVHICLGVSLKTTQKVASEAGRNGEYNVW